MNAPNCRPKPTQKPKPKKKHATKRSFRHAEKVFGVRIQRPRRRYLQHRCGPNSTRMREVGPGTRSFAAAILSGSDPIREWLTYRRPFARAIPCRPAGRHHLPRHLRPAWANTDHLAQWNRELEIAIATAKDSWRDNENNDRNTISQTVS